MRHTKTCTITSSNNCSFLRLWLAQILQLFLHNQLALTRFGRSLRYPEQWRQQYKVIPRKRPATESPGKSLRCFCRAWQNGETFHIFREEEIAEPLSKNTARIQLDGWHQLFKEYLPNYRKIPLYATPQLSRNTGANEDRHLKCTSIELGIFSLFEGFFWGIILKEQWNDYWIRS